MRNLGRSWIFFENEILLVFIYKIRPGKIRAFGIGDGETCSELSIVII